ncbi:hypothetical protein LZ30DRAFT_411708 [Colletotrichum cereale]|nr:hypothetical protein LZ30DRAFT_411708 [Colletotrichum cereale]
MDTKKCFRPELQSHLMRANRASKDDIPARHLQKQRDKVAQACMEMGPALFNSIPCQSKAGFCLPAPTGDEASPLSSIYRENNQWQTPAQLASYFCFNTIATFTTRASHRIRVWSMPQPHLKDLLDLLCIAGVHGRSSVAATGTNEDSHCRLNSVALPPNHIDALYDSMVRRYFRGSRRHLDSCVPRFVLYHPEPSSQQPPESPRASCWIPILGKTQVLPAPTMAHT